MTNNVKTSEDVARYAEVQAHTTVALERELRKREQDRYLLQRWLDRLDQEFPEQVD